MGTSAGGSTPTSPSITVCGSSSSRRPARGGSVQFGTKVTSAAPGSAQGLYLIVSDIEAARSELRASRCRSQPGVPKRRRRALSSSPSARTVALVDPRPNHASYSSFATFSDPDGNGWLLQEITTRLPGRIDAEDGIHIHGGPGERASACGGRPRRAREAARRRGAAATSNPWPNQWVRVPKSLWVKRQARSGVKRRCQKKAIFNEKPDDATLRRHHHRDGPGRPVFGCAVCGRGHGCCHY